MRRRGDAGEDETARRPFGAGARDRSLIMTARPRILVGPFSRSLLRREAVAQDCGLHRTYVGSVERGEVNVSLLNVYKIADALDVRMSALFVE
jgi:transcriptional regulator with XRE-family HTH domain